MEQPPRGRIPDTFDRAFLTGIDGATELVLIRHGEQAIPDPVGGPVGDIIDPPLSERGRRQAQLVGERFIGEHIDAVYASPLARAYDTGAQVAGHHGLTPVVIDDLREVEIFRDIPPERNAVEFIGRDLLLGIRNRMIVERSWDVYPFSESSFEFRKRTVNAIESIIAVNTGKRIVVACHGGVINAYLGHVIGSPFDMFFRPAHTAVNVAFAHEGQRALSVLNDTHHLDGDSELLSH